MASAHILAKKREQVEKLGDIFACSGVYLFDYRGLKVKEFEGLRHKVKGLDGNIQVVKNRLAIKFFERENISIGREILQGTLAIAYSKNKMVELAKVLVDFEKENKKIKICSGLIEKRLVTGQEVVAVAKLPSKEQLLGQLVMSISMPLRKFGSALRAPLFNIAVLMQNLKDKKEQGGSSNA